MLFATQKDDNIIYDTHEKSMSWQKKTEKTCKLIATKAEI